jgi:hypothetical protein
MDHSPLIKAMNSLPFVAWDRFTEDIDQVQAYGWIDRPKDSYKDFVLLTCIESYDGPDILFTTSSSRYSEDIAKILYGHDAEHSACIRVEKGMQGVRRSIRLKGGEKIPILCRIGIHSPDYDQEDGVPRCRRCGTEDLF